MEFNIVSMVASVSSRRADQDGRHAGVHRTHQVAHRVISNMRDLPKPDPRPMPTNRVEGGQEEIRMRLGNAQDELDSAENHWWNSGC